MRVVQFSMKIVDKIFHCAIIRMTSNFDISYLKVVETLLKLLYSNFVTEFYNTVHRCTVLDK